MGADNKERPNASEKQPPRRPDIARELGKAAVDASGVKMP